ncbi:MAG: lytic transglycosylase domain-containing protein [Paracoccaceae bacterium]|nr:lytic transglycosylase domain-containing protein [Paracoccaceae bacterium]
MASGFGFCPQAASPQCAPSAAPISFWAFCASLASNGSNCRSARATFAAQSLSRPVLRSARVTKTRIKRSALGLCLASLCANPALAIDLGTSWPVSGVLDFGATAQSGSGRASPSGVELIGVVRAARPSSRERDAVRSVDRLGAPQIEALVLSAGLSHADDPRLRSAGLSVSAWLSLFRACVETESGFDPAAVSPKGAIGLGQLMPATAARLGIDPSDPAQNLDGAARYLIDQIDRFHRIDWALAAYNAGPDAVDKFHGLPPYAETTAYVRRVLGLYGGDGSTPALNG